MLYTEEQRGDHIEEILGLLYEIALRDSRIPIVLPGREFTDEAGIAVRAFQQAYGLPVTGEIDSATWEAIAAAYHALTDPQLPLTLFPAPGFQLMAGDSGELVHLVQVLMNLAARRFANLEPVPVTGSYDAATEAAVRRLQAVSALPETGRLDRDTWNRLAALLNQMPLAI